MSAEKLAFLQNFYTDVTLYLPAEPAAEAPVPVAPPVPQTAAVTAPLAPKAPAVAPAPLAPASLPIPSRSYSNPTAGLERLASGFNQPGIHPEPAAGPAPRLVAPARAPETAAPAAAPAVPPVMLTQFSTLGDNAQGVLLLFRLPNEQFQKLHRNVFLNKMLQALGLVMADVVLVNVESDLPVALQNLRRELAATHIIAFGKNLLDVTIRNTQIYEPVLFTTLGLSYLASATVDLVEYDVSLKKRLWPGLQAMFSNAQ
ncbi:hypothetical protein BEN47_02050 [Hymenobacter lapidarius]|uniref:Uncharacterized protein n=1 Tax=Hymenobacter lapidarius TaxID=1908237 RepID=A0A1G1T2P6_9BACT|nr:hypothetical protein [Hymenobacter lapidarius]OGX85139.1 hypothetical protein BEN47_02050 [Hymenobacter lapidarius]